MKTKLALIAALLAPLSAMATPIPGASATVTVTLTASHTEAVTDTETSYVTKQVVLRYSNKELLTDLMAEGYLSDSVLTGWKLVIVDRTPLLSDDNNTLVFYAIKTGLAPVVIPAARFGLDVSTNAAAEAKKHTLSGGNVTSVNDKFKSIVGVSGHQQLDGPDGYDESFELTSIANGGNASKVLGIKQENVTYNFTFNLLGAIKLSPIIGILTDNNSDDQVPVEGSISFSAFVPLDITSYPPDNT